MVRKHNIIEIPKEDIFKNDKLNRKKTIINLSQFITNNSEPLTIAINAKWGDGKTTFIRLWQEYLKQNGIQSIYFNAWQYDYSNEPLIVLLGEFNQYILNNYLNNEIIEKLDKVKDIGAKIVKNALPAFVKGATAGLLELDKGYESAISALSENSIKTLIDEYSKEKKIIEKFKKSIESLLEKITDKKSFVIFIDELDRCKPLFAINLLERIKHLFEIYRLIFVFSIDKIQLIESIKSQYGNIDGENYLKRFFDIDYALPKPNKDIFCEYLNEFYKWNKLLQSKDINGFNHQVSYLEIIKYLSKSLNLSLREIEKIYIYTDIIYKTLNDRTYEIIIRICMFFVIIKLKNETLYSKLINRQEKPEYFFEILFDENIKNEYRETPIIVTLLKAFIYVTIFDDKELNIFIKQQKEKLLKLQGENSNQGFNNKTNDLEWLIEILEHRFNFKKLKDFIPFAIEKVEFLQDFKLAE